MIATPEQYQAALLKLRDKGRLRNTQYRQMLAAQYASPNHTITATRLAEAVGYANYNAANLQYGTLGREIAEVLEYTPPTREDGTFMWFWTLSSGNDASPETLDGHYEFIMRPELVAALENMKWVK
ncbi:hypothetical protein [Thiofilum flexile]|uniref:hypothetical protein n=1 Tax=Thiofilum flexile TaxID=125627 RepID=UPI000377A98E|nr:hypothetical protein [Thiofilum flexile]